MMSEVNTLYWNYYIEIDSDTNISRDNRFQLDSSAREKSKSRAVKGFEPNFELLIILEADI